MKTCKVNECLRPSIALNLCFAHYKRYKRTGTVGEKPIKELNQYTECSIDGCILSHHGLSFCSRHYEKFKRDQQPIKITPTELWISQNIVDTEDCIIWKNTEKTFRYHTLRINGKSTTAHRYILQKFKGAAPEGKTHCLHSCNVKACVNPKHLRWGTHQENMNDRSKSDTWIKLKGSGSSRSKLTEQDVINIRQRYLKGETISSIHKNGYNFVNKSNISLITQGKTWKHLL